MPIHAAWPRSRRRALARLLGQQITIRDLHADRARLQRALDAARHDRDIALYLYAEATWQLDTWQAHTNRFLESDECRRARQEVARLNRLLVSQADHLAASRREVDQLHADIARMRPVLMPRETR